MGFVRKNRGVCSPSSQTAEMLVAKAEASFADVPVFEFDTGGVFAERLRSRQELNLEVLPDCDFAVVGSPSFGVKGSGSRRALRELADIANCVGVVLVQTGGAVSAESDMFTDQRWTVSEEIALDGEVFAGEGGKSFVWDAVARVYVRSSIGLSETKRPIVRAFKEGANHPDLNFTTAKLASMTVRRAGWKAGQVGTDTKVTESTHLFLAPSPEGIRALINGESLLTAAADSGRAVRSIPRVRVIEVLVEAGLLPRR
jgi:hypothetical protein